jgi:hypothetical protein
MQHLTFLIVIVIVVIIVIVCSLQLPEGIKWRFIGHLQSNKCKVQQSAGGDERSLTQARCLTCVCCLIDTPPVAAASAERAQPRLRGDGR